MRILLIEDDPLIGNGIQIGLTKSGFAVDWFTDGKIGLEAAQSAPYDTVVLDLTLPKMDGLDVLQAWRQKGIDVPVLILTARDTVDERITGLQRGADDYLCKPFALDRSGSALACVDSTSLRPCQSCNSNIVWYALSQINARYLLRDQEIFLTTREYKVARTVYV